MPRLIEKLHIFGKIATIEQIAKIGDLFNTAGTAEGERKAARKAARKAGREGGDGVD